MTNDFIMREIEGLTRFLGKVLFHKEPAVLAVVDEQGNLNHEVFLLYRLNGLIRDLKVNEAENLLFETIQEDPNPGYLKAALDFYGTLAGMTDSQLAACDFSREEIAEGLREIKKMFA